MRLCVTQMFVQDVWQVDIDTILNDVCQCYTGVFTAGTILYKQWLGYFHLHNMKNFKLHLGDPCSPYSRRVCYAFKDLYITTPTYN